MNQKLALAFMVVLSLSIGGCSGNRNNYWLLYNHNPNIVPAATYQGYYTDSTGDKTDDDIEKCITDKRSERFPKCAGLARNPGAKPPLTDNDQAKVMVHVDPNKISVNELECEIKQTKITRSPNPLYDQEGAKLLEEETTPPSIYVCDLHATDAGGMRLDYIVRPTQPTPSSKQAAGKQPERTTVNGTQLLMDQSLKNKGANGKSQQPASQTGSTPPPPTTGTAENPSAKNTPDAEGTTITIKPAVVNDSIEVHTLYRFRVLVGPVYSSVTDRTYTTKAHAGGTSYVASDANGNPVHAAAFLKYYWKPRDVYKTTPCFKSESAITDCLATINPIVGLGISDNPLKNVYIGGSLDILPGLDIVGGVHWSSVQTLSGGFAQGQIVPTGTIIPTEQRFLPGWFIGIAVDTGVAGTWISKATTSLFK